MQNDQARSRDYNDPMGRRLLGIGADGPNMCADFLDDQPRDLLLRHAHGSIRALGLALRRHGIALGT